MSQDTPAADQMCCLGYHDHSEGGLNSKRGHTKSGLQIDPNIENIFKLTI